MSEPSCNCPCMDCIEGQHCGAESDASVFGQPEVKFSCGYWWVPMEEEERRREEHERDCRFWGSDEDEEYYDAEPSY